MIGLLFFGFLVDCTSYPSFRQAGTIKMRNFSVGKHTGGSNSIYDSSENRIFSILDGNRGGNEVVLHNRTGIVGYKNTQRNVPVDKIVVLECTSTLLNILNVSDFRVDIWFCSESKIRHLNQEWRGVNRSTDILSFPAIEFISAEVFDCDDPTLAFEKHLGDIVIAPTYVKRACYSDKYFEEKGKLDRENEKGCYREMSNLFID